jgi:hypothetical protein
VKEDFAAVSGILEAEFDARKPFQREAGLKISVIDRGAEQDV